MAENLVELIDASEGGILRHLCHRFSHGKTYTRLGNGNLIAINPNEILPIYDTAVAERYKLDDHSLQHANTEAHIYSIAGHLLSSVTESPRETNRLALRFRGDSGAGKTENLFHVLRFLAVHQNAMLLTWDKVDALEAICAAFCGAETTTSKNSTRCGYKIDLGYSRGMLSSFVIRRTLPLELSCLVGDGNASDKNFSIFYQFCAGLESRSRKKYGVKHASNYFYLRNPSNETQSTDEERLQDGENFQKLCGALRTVGFTGNQLDLIWRLVAAILHAGNIFFHSQGRRAQVANDTELEWIATLLEIDQVTLLRYFGEADTVEECLNRRDALAKVLYKGLHNWLLLRISRFLSSSGEKAVGSEQSSTLTLVDIPGPVNLPESGLNELCVNMVNEVAESFDLYCAFSHLPSLLEAEEVSNIPPQLHFPADNQRAVNLLVKRPGALVSVLEDECKFPKGSDESFLQRVCIGHTTNSAYKMPHEKEDGMVFGVKHYIGTVWYSAHGMVQANKWMEPAALHHMLSTSGDPSISAIFAPLASKGERVNYVASQFAAAAQSLFGELKSTHCHFVHCFRPNSTREAGRFDAKCVEKQIRVNHLLGHYKVNRYGFTKHMPIATFVRDYQCLLPDEAIKGKSLVQITKCVIESTGQEWTDDYRIGVCSVFLRDPLLDRLQQALAIKRNMTASTIQKNYKRWKAQLHYRRTLGAVIKIQATLRNWQKERSRRKAEAANRLECGDESMKGKNCATTVPACPIPTQWELPAELHRRLCKLNSTRESPFRHTTEYIASTHARPLRPAPVTEATASMTIEEFARENIKVCGCAGSLRKLSSLAPKFQHHILGARREPILSPFLPLECDSDFESAVETFRIILRYTNDPTLSDEQAALLAASIILRGIENPALKDELYVQLINQTYRNPAGQIANKAWDLLLMATGSFAPSPELISVACNYFQNSVRFTPFAELLINGMLRSSEIESEGGSGRCKPPSVLEHVALRRRQAAGVNVRMAEGGEEVNVEVDPWTSTEDVFETDPAWESSIAAFRGVVDASNWCLELKCGAKSTRISAAQRIFDGIATMEELNSTGNSPLVLFSQPQYTQVRIHDPTNGLNSPQSSDISRVIPRSLSSKSVLARYNNGGLLIPNGGDQVCPRRTNPNCMSRITEEEGPTSRQPSFIGDNDFSKLTIASRIRRMPLPSRGEDVGKFLDEVFEQALPDGEEDGRSQTGTLSPHSAELVRRVAASIKGGMSRDLDVNGRQGLFTDDRSEIDPIYQESIGRISVRGLRRTAALNHNEAAAFGTANYPCAQHRRIDSGDSREPVGDLACLDAIVDGPQWISDSELSMQPRPTRGIRRDWRSNGGEVVCNFWAVASAIGKGTGQLPPVLCYKNQPFEIFIKREIFFPHEELDDGFEIDTIFAQIFADCRQEGTTPRIRSYERESVMQLLHEYTSVDGRNVCPCEVPTSVKLHVIEVARRWPLYFSRFYPLIDERERSHDGAGTPLIVGIGETGVRLLTLKKSNHDGGGELLQIQDHLAFYDIVELVLEEDGCRLRVVTRTDNEMLLNSPRHSVAINHCIGQYMSRSAAGAKSRRYMLALADYSTDSEEMLDFRAGDFIQLIDDPPGLSRLPFGSPSWLYGKVRQNSAVREIGKSVGWFLSEYAEPVVEEDSVCENVTSNRQTMF